MKTNLIKPNINAIPSILKSKSHWICWKKAEPKPNGRYGKLPTNIHGSVINAHDKAHHVDLNTAYQSYLVNTGNIAGIALDLPNEPEIYDHTEEGFPLYLIGGDIDECITIKNNKPILSEQAKKDLKLLGEPYWEISPSGTGIRWFGLHTKPLKGGNKNGREMYSQGRFLTITGLTKCGEIRVLPSDIELIAHGWFNKVNTSNINEDLSANLSKSKYEMPEIIHDGEGRNSGLLQFAGSLRAKDLPQDQIELACIGFNQERIKPPLPIDKVIDIARRYEKQTTEPIEATHQTKKLFQLNLEKGIIDLVSNSPQRPFIAGNDLIPIGTYSALAGLGGIGKTNAVIGVAVQAAIGGRFADRECKETCVLMLACEDSEAEINARFCALIEKLPTDEQAKALKNIRVFSLVGQDIHMVKMEGRNAEPTHSADIVIQAANKLKLMTGLDRCLIVIDHARMIASIDWNDSGQASVFTREMQHIASETNAGVVVLTHTNKKAMDADHAFNQGDVSGSSAIVDNARWVGMIRPMGAEDAKKFGIVEDARQQYISLDIVKSNYSAIGNVGWFIKQSVPHHSTSILEHVRLEKPIPTQIGDNALEKRIIEHIKTRKGETINKVKGLAGTKGKFKASEKIVLNTIHELIEKGMITNEKPSDELRKELGLPKNTVGILAVVEGL